MESSPSGSLSQGERERKANPDKPEPLSRRGLGGRWERGWGEDSPGMPLKRYRRV
jgi:hypothetical protein